MGQFGTVVTPQPVAAGVSGNRARGRPRQRGPQVQRADCDDGARAEHDDGAGNEQPNDRERFGERGEKNRRIGPLRMSGNPGD